MIGQTVSHYRVLEKLGAGGMGVVYKAQDLRLDRAVALKFLPDNLLNDPLALERFRREVQAASALNHPGICTIYDAGEEGGKPFIAMEFIDGEALSQFIHGKPLGVEQILMLGIQLADALSVAHAQGIIHRDIKPANIYVTRRGQAKVLDFGLAKLTQKSGTIGAEGGAEASANTTSIVGVISGTPSYMSPEQIRGDDLDARTDVFSLGLLLYEMATGQKAFSGNTGGVVIEAILTRTPTAIRSINPEIPEELEAVINKAVSKDISQRYQSAAELCADLQVVKRGLDTGHTVASMISPSVSAAIASGAESQTTKTSGGFARWKWAVGGGLAAAAIVVALGTWLRTERRTHALEETDTIVVADFTNKTGDAVFDDTLRQGLAAELQQSPFLSLVSEQKVQQTLQMMGMPADAKLTPELARVVCQRAASKAYLSGSISTLGSQYVIGINAVNCQTGNYLARQQVTADNKEGVLKALDSATVKLRETLGESLKTIQKLDTPIEEATTPSLEALQAYSLGRKMMMGKGDYRAAVPLFQRATTLDPKFAMAYGLLGTCYSNLGEANLAAEDTEKSYKLRGHVSEWEKFYIESHFYHFVTGDLEKAQQAYETWAQTYPREYVPPGNLGVIYQTLGQYEKALTNIREAIRLGPAVAIHYANLVNTYTRMNRFDEAHSVANDAISKKLESPDLHYYTYNLDFLRGDTEGMAKEIGWSTGKPGKDTILIYLEAETAAYAGQLGKARELSRAAVASAQQVNEKEIAARCESAAALREAVFGNPTEAKREAAATLAFSNGRDAQYVAALAVAIAGDSEQAQISADDLAKRFPQDTLVQFNYLPSLRAQVLLNHPGEGLKAVEALKPSIPYEYGAPGNSIFSISMYPVYLRGMAYLDARQGAQAAAEFQKIIDRPGTVIGEPIGPLAYLGLGRAYAMSGDSSKAKTAYQGFFKLWKSADVDVPVLKAAKAEYSKLG
jgi:eukaryotic-like serine/threonine-protein kinase